MACTTLYFFLWLQIIEDLSLLCSQLVVLVTDFVGLPFFEGDICLKKNFKNSDRGLFLQEYWGIKQWVEQWFANLVIPSNHLGYYEQGSWGMSLRNWYFFLNKLPRCIQDLESLSFTANPSSWVLGCLRQAEEIWKPFPYLSFICLEDGTYKAWQFKEAQRDPCHYWCIQKRCLLFRKYLVTQLAWHLGYNSGLRQCQGLK